MGPVLDAVETTPAAPASVDVAIVGGGIIGLSTAPFLSEHGLKVAVCDKGGFGAEQSSRNWGWVRRMGRDPRELPLIVEALRLWDGMAERVGRDVGFRRTGILYLCDSEADVERRRDWLSRAGAYALDSRIVTGDELSALLPGATQKFPAALYTASDARAEPQKAAPAIAAAARAAGAALLAECAVREIETEGGRVCGLVTERGRIAARHVVVAGGVWSSALLRTLGVRLPQLGVRSSVMRTGPVQGGPETAALGPRFAYRKRLDGGCSVAQGVSSRHDVTTDSFRYFRDFWPLLTHEWGSVAVRVGEPLLKSVEGTPLRSRLEDTRILDPDPEREQLKAAYAAFRETFPVFRDVPVAQEWAGVIDATPDAVPVISPVESHPGLIVATGFSGHGFGIGPGAGRLVADLVTGAKPVVDPTPFRHSRFIDGTKPRPTTGV